MNHYKLHEHPQAKKDFEAAFGIPIGQFYDGMMTMAFKQISIDPFKLDDWLHQKFGEYEEEQQKSMQDIIKEHYGFKGMLVFLKLMPPQSKDDDND